MGGEVTQEVLSTSPDSQTESGDDSGFGVRVRNAVAWRWGTQVLAQIITWTSTFAVVRLLDPSDYGLFAMTQVMLNALAFLNGYSFATSLIQADHIDKRRVGQVFGLLLIMNTCLAIAQFLLAPVAADYYGQPQVEAMLKVQAVIFLTTPFIALPSALLSRQIQFKNQGLVNLLCAVVGAGTALALAWLGHGVWALVYAPIAMFTVKALGLTISARLLVWPVFDFRGAGDIISFGGALTLCQLFWIVQSQSDILIAGRAFDVHDLGLYAEALFVTLIITARFLPPINEVAFPAYAELHKKGKPLAEPFLRTARTVILVTAPLYVGLALTADAAILTLFGPKWTEMAPIAAGLALAMPFFALQIVCSPATNAIGRPRIYVASSIVGAILFPCAFLWGISAGPMGLVHAWWVAAPGLLIATLMLTLPAINVRFCDLLTQLIPAIVGCAVMAATVSGAKLLTAGLFAPVELLCLAAIGGITYAATLWLIWPNVIRETWAMLRQRDAMPDTDISGANTKA